MQGMNRKPPIRNILLNSRENLGFLTEGFITKIGIIIELLPNLGIVSKIEFGGLSPVLS